MNALEASGLTVAVGAVHVTLLVIFTAAIGMLPDSWLALVVGREIAAHGLQTRNLLTATTLGRTWVDQQWLGEVALFELYRITRDQLAIALALIGPIPAFFGALALARRAASDRAVAAAGLLVLVPFVVQASQTRTQSLAYPLFVIMLLLLTRTGSWPTRVGAIAVIALWANIHGSVLLAAGAASLRWLQDARAHPSRTVVLLLATWLAVFCSPYALGLPAYYHSTVLNPAFTQVLAEWRPLTLTPRLLPVWILIAGVVWTIARSRRGVLTFSPALLLVLIVMTLHSVRAVTFLALAAAILLPPYFERRVESRSFRPAAWLAPASLVVAAAVTAASLASSAASPYSPRAAAVAARVTGARKAFTPLELGDWLLWVEPQLRGRVAMDARAELLTPTELRRAAALWEEAADWPAAVAGYRSVTLSTRSDPRLVDRLLAAPRQFRLVYRDAKMVVFARRQP